MLDGEALRGSCEARLSAYKVPKFIWVTDKAQLPFTATGKIKKSDLAEQLSGLLASGNRAASRRLVVSKVNGIPNNGSNFTSVTSNPSPSTCCRKSDLAPWRNAMCSAASQSAVRTTTENKPSPLRARKSAAVPRRSVRWLSAR